MKKLIDKKKNSSKTESSLLSAKFNGLTNKDDVDQLSKYIKNTIDYLNYKEHDVNKLYEIYKYLKGISNSIRTIYFDAADKCGKCFLNKDYNLNTCIDLLKPLYENGYEIYYNYFFFENKLIIAINNNAIKEKTKVKMGRPIIMYPAPHGVSFEKEII